MLILLIPLLVASPELLGMTRDNPMLTVGDIGTARHLAWLPGFAYIDPNVGFTTQALGGLSARLWLQGIVPWWNPYSGVGMPLAGEFQPAAFSPFNLLLLLRHGVTLRHLSMQYVAGFGTYFLIRQMGCSGIAAITGALLFAQNGALAWFGHSPPDPACFLPWVLLGIERAAISGSLKRPALTGWRLLGLTTAATILSGFPETAYICGLFAALYFLWRCAGCDAPDRLAMLARVALGGAAGIALAAPQLLAFAEFLPGSMVGGHAGMFGHIGLPPASILPSFLAPYVYGPIFAYRSPVTNDVWGSIGGYCDLPMLTLATAGLAARRDALGWGLVAWVVLCSLKIFAVAPISDFWNDLPEMNSIAFFRYAPGSVEFALILLGCFAIDALRKPHRPDRRMLAAAASICIFGLAYGFSKLPTLWATFPDRPDIRHWVMLSYAWMTISSLFALVPLGPTQLRLRAEVIAALLIVDATLMFAIPTLSNPRHDQVDRAAIAFLQTHIGLQRFYTLGPIAPNYGAYFQIASINHAYLPVPSLWTDYVRAHLDPDADPISFSGAHSTPQSPTALDAFRSDLPAFTAIGVRYLVAPTAMVPAYDAAPVYRDPRITIYDLPGAASYFDTKGECRLHPLSRDVLIANCMKPAVLLRREMYFNGWHAAVDGKAVSIASASGLFQSIVIPAGNSRVAFFFAPPHVIWAWCAFWAATLLIGAQRIVQQAAYCARRSRNPGSFD